MAARKVSLRKTPKSSPEVPSVVTTTDQQNKLLLAILGVSLLSILLSLVVGGFVVWRFLSLDDQLTQAPAADVTSAFARYAKKIGINDGKFKECLAAGKYTQSVSNDALAGQQAGVSGTPTFYINGRELVGAQPYSVFKSAIDAELKTAQSTSPFDSLLPQAYAQTIEDTTLSPIPTPTPLVRVNVDPGHLPAQGKDNAKVTIVEFSDFQCPYCESFFTTTYAQIKKDYVDTGKVKVFYRHYPLPFHANAQIAAEAAECANEQGKFWDFHDILFKNQKQWETLPRATS